MAPEVSRGQVLSFAKGDHGLDRLAEHGIRNADDGCFRDLVQGVQDVLDFLGAHLLAPRLDDVVPAAHEVQVAFFVGLEEVAGVEHPFPGQGSGLQDPVRLLGLVPVSLPDVGAADHELADLARFGIPRPTEAGRTSIWSGGR